MELRKRITLAVQNHITNKAITRSSKIDIAWAKVVLEHVTDAWVPDDVLRSVLTELGFVITKSGWVKAKWIGSKEFATMARRGCLCITACPEHKQTAMYGGE